MGNDLDNCIKIKISSYKEVSAVKTQAFIKEWKKKFTSDPQKLKNVKGLSEHLWHYFSYSNTPNCLNYTEVIETKAKQKPQENCFIFDESQDVGIIVNICSLNKMMDCVYKKDEQRYIDIYIISIDLSWALILPHEMDLSNLMNGIGPFFIE